MSVGMPDSLKLHEFGSMVWDAFGDCPFCEIKSMRMEMVYLQEKGEKLQQQNKELVEALEKMKELSCSCGNHYINGVLESYKCVPCRTLAKVRGEK